MNTHHHKFSYQKKHVLIHITWKCFYAQKATKRFVMSTSNEMPVLILNDLILHL